MSLKTLIGMLGQKAFRFIIIHAKFISKLKASIRPGNKNKSELENKQTSNDNTTYLKPSKEVPEIY